MFWYRGELGGGRQYDDRHGRTGQFSGRQYSRCCSPAAGFIHRRAMLMLASEVGMLAQAAQTPAITGVVEVLPGADFQVAVESPHQITYVLAVVIVKDFFLVSITLIMWKSSAFQGSAVAFFTCGGHTYKN